MQLIRKIKIGLVLVVGFGLFTLTLPTPIEAYCGGDCSVGECQKCSGKGKQRYCITVWCSSCSGSCQQVGCPPGFFEISGDRCRAIGPVATPKPDPVDPPPPACTASAPGTITLLSPSDGMFMANTTVSLLWNSVASWGTACSGANNQYRLYLGTTNPPPLYATYDSGTLSTNYLGTKGSTYYWYVQAGNGQLTRNSATFSFTILNDQITGQVFYDRANNCGGSGWSTGGVAVSLDGGVGNAIAADGSFNLTASPLSSHTLEVSIPVGYVCSTVSGCNSCSRIGIASPSANNNFYLTDLLEPWWQAAGAGVYAGGLGGGVTVRSQLPTAETSLILPGTTGSVGALLRASGSVGVGNGRVSDEGYSTMARYRGKKMDYNFFAAQMGVDKL